MLGWRSQGRRATTRLLVAAAIAWSGEASADGESTRAREAYDRGIVAFQRGEFAAAAREFATADAMVPSGVALHAALDAAIRADDPVLGVELLERVARGPADGALETTARDARAKFARRTGRVSLVCGTSPCRATIDGAAVEGGARVVLRVGPHTAMIESDGRRERRDVDVPPDDTVVLSPADAAVATPPPMKPRPRVSDGVSPVWVYFGIGATAIVGGLSVASGIDTAKKHSNFVDAGCDRGGPGCLTSANDGSSAQTRTNVLLGVTAALGVTTAAIAIFAVRWKKDASVAVGMVHGAPCASLRLPF